MAEQHETEVGRGGRGRGRRISLTTQRIADATCPAEKGELMLWDAEVSGLAVRLLPTGRKTFVIYYRAEGGGRTAPQRKMSLGEVGRISLRDARRAALAHLGSVAKGGDPAAELRERRRRERSRLAAALERYAFDLERRQVVKRREVESLLRRELLKKLGDIDLAELGRAEVVQRIEEIEAEGRPGTSRDALIGIRGGRAKGEERG